MQVPGELRPAMILDLAARTRWKRGRAGERDGSALVSYTEFRPRSLRDMPAIYRASERLRDEGVRLEGAIGIVTYWQPFRRCVGSLSFWTGEDALRRFVSLPFHVEIMRAYRDRGRLRAVSWRTDDLRLRPAFARGRRALSEGMGRQGQR